VASFKQPLDIGHFELEISAMLNFLPETLIGVITFLVSMLNNLFWGTILLAVALFKLMLPFKPVQLVINRILNGIAQNWISCNSGWMYLVQKTQWDVQGMEGLSYKSWYLLSSNHQSYADIFVLQHLLNRKIPLLKFYIKRELIYFPILGLVWWALDFPFVRRHSPEYLEKHPEERTKDLETVRRACEKFALMPTSVINFLEGTRFSQAKHKRQQSAYKFLLRPKAGGIALALSTLGGKFKSLIDITIVYPDGVPSFWDFLCGRIKRVVVRIRELPIPAQLIGGDYEGDPGFRTDFQRWINQMWLEKDRQIEQILSAISKSPHPPFTKGG